MIQVLQDNYAYLLIDKERKVAAAVDAVEPTKVLAAAKEEGVTVESVLTTHNHWDHAGGNEEMKKLLKDVPFIAGKGEDVPGQTKEVSEGDVFKVGGLDVHVLETPYHTRHHVCFFIDADGERAVFTGDALFVCGCGNVNAGGTKEELLSCFRKLGKLPNDTLVYCGHEYTTSNFTYAFSVEPRNDEMTAKRAWVAEQRRNGKPTIPSTIGEEHATSPFMRAAFKSSAAINLLSQVCGEGGEAERVMFLRMDKSGGAWKERLQKNQQKL